MDEDRRVRFFVAPLLLIASLLWGAWLDQNNRPFIIHFLLHTDNLSKLIGLAAAAGFVVFTFGYVIGTITYFFLSIFFWLRAKLCRGKSQFHEVALSEATLNRVRERLRYSGTAEPRQQELSAGVAFDHGLLRKTNYEGVHLWLVRRWSAFSIGATSTTGLLLVQ
jgi:hypothetical protein